MNEPTREQFTNHINLGYRRFRNAVNRSFVAQMNQQAREKNVPYRLVQLNEVQFTVMDVADANAWEKLRGPKPPHTKWLKERHEATTNTTAVA